MCPTAASLNMCGSTNRSASFSGLRVVARPGGVARGDTVSYFNAATGERAHSFHAAYSNEFLARNRGFGLPGKVPWCGLLAPGHLTCGKGPQLTGNRISIHRG
eukprot:365555-Chlamydomonas_euryale.AAC.10